MPIDGVSDALERGANVKYGRELGFLGQKASKKFIWRICKVCGEGAWVRKDSFRDTCKRCSADEMRERWLLVSNNQRGDRNPNWRGGMITDHLGYRLIRLKPDSPFYPMAKSNGYIYEHRLIMAKKLGRCLQPWEHVHHIDGKRDHNTEMNLELTRQVHHPHSYSQGYRQGYKDGQRAKVAELEKQIRLLRLQIGELKALIQPQLYERRDIHVPHS